MGQRQILVIEDDPAIRRGIVDALRFHTFAVQEAGTGPRGLEMAVQGEINLVLLDLVLPGMDGLDILTEIRKSRPSLPVIVLTARGDESDRVRGLKLGADDYVVKPFSVKELLARVEAVLRRSPERPDDPDLSAVDFPGGRADFSRREIRCAGGERRELSERECELLRYLAVNAGRAISRDEILTRVWRLSGNGAETRTIDMHIARLREKLSDNPADPKVLMTVRGKGYLFSGTST